MDKEKVIEAFDEAKELVWTDDDEYTVGYNNGLEAGKNIALALLKEQKTPILTIDDAVSELMDRHYDRLKEQEAKPPAIMQDIEGIWSTCSMCGHKLRPILAMKMDTYFPKFCSECGQGVKWE